MKPRDTSLKAVFNCAGWSPSGLQVPPSVRMSTLAVFDLDGVLKSSDLEATERCMMGSEICFGAADMKSRVSVHVYRNF